MSAARHVGTLNGASSPARHHGYDTMGKDRHIPRIHIDTKLERGAVVALDASVVHRLVNVMRKGDGDSVLVFNGRDGEWTGALSSIRKKSATLNIARQTRLQPAPAALTLAFAPLKHARLDYVAQKAAEMGVARIVPVLTRHTVAGKLNLDRFRAHVIEGAEQCGVLWIADVTEPVPLTRFLEMRDRDEPLVFCDEAAPIADPLAVMAGIKTPLTVLVGPEGGFSEDEREALLAHPAARPVSLGPRIMRADTAIVAALALVQTTSGDWAT